MPRADASQTPVSGRQTDQAHFTQCFTSLGATYQTLEYRRISLQATFVMFLKTLLDQNIGGLTRRVKIPRAFFQQLLAAAFK